VRYAIDFITRYPKVFANGFFDRLHCHAKLCRAKAINICPWLYIFYILVCCQATVLGGSKPIDTAQKNSKKTDQS
ncbi:uncharacterized protein METZ01_LOCUS166003, partial [marine metagenome]